MSAGPNMRRKCTRSSAKSPEKAKEEKPAKKSRRHAKRQKATSSESERESDDEVSLSSNDNGNTPTEKELWTVTQTDQTNNDIGKIKICLARPSPATPERSSKRLRNRSAAAEDSSSEEVKPSTRRSRRRGGSSPQKKDEPSPIEHAECGDEKKGKGKSKGKHKSKIVEQTADVDEHTEMQSELSENAQVTPQSPQNVDNSAADIVDRELKQFEASCAEESVQSVDDDRHDTLETRTEHDLSNNNLTNVERLSPAHVVKPEGAGDEAADVPQAAILKDSLEPKAEDCENVSQTEEIEPEPENIDKTQENLQQTSSVIVPSLDIRTEQKQDGEEQSGLADIDETKDEHEGKEIAKQKSDESEQGDESIEAQITQSIKIAETQVTTASPLGKSEDTSEEVETSREHSTSPETRPEEGSNEKDGQTSNLESKKLISLTDEVSNHQETIKDEMPDNKLKDPPEVKGSAEPCVETKQEMKKSLPAVTQEEGLQARVLRKRSWGEGAKSPEFLIITSKRLGEMYPNLAMQDESSVKLQSKREQRKEYIVERPPAKVAVERRLDVDESKKQPQSAELDNGHEGSPEQDAPVSEQENGTASISNILYRKISIVEDEASMLKPPPSPAKHDKSDVLFITNLVRPFTVKQLRGLLERTGKITEEGFWTDKIKSKCFVQYETEEEAEATRNALHGVLWPVGNGKKLIIDFAMQADLENAKNPPIIPPVVADESAKENKLQANQPEIADVPINKEGQETSTLWNEEYKETKSLQRPSSPVARKRQHRMRSRSFSEEPKKKSRREDPTPQRAMDDLFRKTISTPSIYWQPLTPEEIELKQQQRQERMEAHKRKMESEMRTRRNSDRQHGGPYRRRF